MTLSGLVLLLSLGSSGSVPDGDERIDEVAPPSLTDAPRAASLPPEAARPLEAAPRGELAPASTGRVVGYLAASFLLSQPMFAVSIAPAVPFLFLLSQSGFGTSRGSSLLPPSRSGLPEPCSSPISRCRC